MEQISNQIAAAALLSFLIQRLKGSTWFPWITAESEKVNRILAIVGSGLAALGIHIACSKVNHQCAVTWVDGMTIASGLWHWATQFAITHGWFKLVTEKK